MTFSQIFIFFVACSVAGWVCEMLWCSIGARKLSPNRGFLIGPWCPIYGFGGLLVIALSPSQSAGTGGIIATFFISMIAASVLEYFTGALLEAIFQMRWWDYSHRRFNIRGRVCLGNSVAFGLLGVALTQLKGFSLFEPLNRVPTEYQRVLASFLFALFLADLFKSLANVMHLQERIRGLRAVIEELDAARREYSWFERGDIAGSLRRLHELAERGDVPSPLRAAVTKIESLRQSNYKTSRILRAFPALKPSGLEEELAALRQGIDQWRDSFRQRQKELRREARERTKAAYKDVNITRLIWVFFVGCIVGYVVETVFCLLTNGVIESRQGVLYGPFSQIYGFGAVILVLLLSPLSEFSDRVLFVASAVYGGLFEAAASLIQELMFGTVSWEYSAKALSLLNGRTNLLYMVFWGALGIACIRWFYPRVYNFVASLQLRSRRFFTILIAVTMSFNMLLSACAVSRWSERQEGIPPQTRFDELMDANYPNELLEEIYPNMQFVDR